MSSTATATTAAAGVKAPKRFACDDCRARKVQCSGDATGCVRCRRADIPCHYSAPKPPGRPRKLRRVEPPTVTATTTATSYNPEPNFLGGAAVDGGLGFPTFGDGEGTWGPTDQEFAGIFAGGMFDGDGGLFTSNSLPLYTPNDSTASTPPSYAIPATNAFPTPKSIASSWSTASLLSPQEIALISSPARCNLLSPTGSPPCNCLNSFVGAISTLRSPSCNGSFSLPTTLTTIRDAMAAISLSLSCHYCHSTLQATYVCMMMLGTLIPLLLLFIETSLASIAAAATPGMRTVLLAYDVEVELAAEAWESMATDAVRKEFEELMGMISTIEGCLKQRFGTSEGDGLSLIAAGDGGRMGTELRDTRHKTAEPPFCVGLLWMIRGMAERVRGRVCD
ncbi:hypothetical protein EDC01DRAFT_125666 [Geopyxis carbonaria]|nr:hypothetical protein EDC01DRAFT_125666 [Geopyxis carbonaria]